MNNPFEMVVIIVAIVMVAGIVRGVLGLPRHRRFHPQAMEPVARDDAETEALRDEVRTLKERIAVLERIATDSSNRLGEEIDQLRDR